MLSCCHGIAWHPTLLPCRILVGHTPSLPEHVDRGLFNIVLWRGDDLRAIQLSLGGDRVGMDSLMPDNLPSGVLGLCLPATPCSASTCACRPCPTQVADARLGTLGGRQHCSCMHRVGGPGMPRCHQQEHCAFVCLVQCCNTASLWRKESPSCCSGACTLPMRLAASQLATSCPSLSPVRQRRGCCTYRSSGCPALVCLLPAH